MKVKKKSNRSDGKPADYLSLNAASDEKLVSIKSETTTQAQDISKKSPDQRPNRKGRLIVRNLPYKITLEKLKKHFNQCGDLTDVNILKKPDGRLVGCGFVQFSSPLNAAKAIAQFNGKPLLGRPIVVDWAVPKNLYNQVMTEQNIKKEVDDSVSDTAESETESKKGFDRQIVPRVSGADDFDNDNDSAYSDSNDGKDEDDGEDEDEDDEDEDDEDDDDDGGEDDDAVGRSKKHHPSDIPEGCTVFVKNIPFSITNDELRNCMKKFGRMCYALVCIDPLTEHSKGSGFVKFRSKNSAEACLAAGNEKSIILQDRVVEVHPALTRDDVKKPHKRDREQTDNRNLYLAKEGVILADSPAASGISTFDMEKRLALEEKKRRLLNNLHNFISRIRLCVYNIPLTYDDRQFRSLFLKHGGHKPVLTEARIMRNLRDVDANGVGRSKGFGFVTFTSHDNALQALRAINNNPSVFSPAKRPIVLFSIENRTKVNVKQKRLEKSRRKNLETSNETQSQKQWERDRRFQQNQSRVHVSGSSKDKKPQEIISAPQTSQGRTVHQISKKERRKARKLESYDERMSEPKAIENRFQGQKGLPGQTKVMSKRKLQEQAQIHHQTVKNRKKTNRQKKLTTTEKMKQPKQKVKQPREFRKEDTFSKLVDRYKQQLNSTIQEQKKWYDV